MALNPEKLLLWAGEPVYSILLSIESVAITEHVLVSMIFGYGYFCSPSGSTAWE